MATYSKQFLSSLIDYTDAKGKPLVVTATSSGSPQQIHQTQVNADVIDEIWIYASNTASASVLLTMVLDTTEIKVTIPSQSGLTLVIPGLTLKGNSLESATVSAYASTANAIAISGYVNRIS